MTDDTERRSARPEVGADLSDDDLYEALEEISGYLDVTPADLKEVYRLAYRHATQRMRTTQKAGDVMTSPVAAVRPETPLAEVAAVLAEHAVSGAPVVDARGGVVGVVSEKDFLSHVGSGRAKSFMGIVAEGLAGERREFTVTLRGAAAGDLMASPAVTVREDTPLGEIIDLMAARAINRVPVTDETGRLIGIVTRGDIVRAVGRGAEP